ncbi:unnamed protein product [Trypanosoma congolense IL3000]|uniref:WGS project CAEQ00000000 data, annotated contig 1174 n=1 Tax=Trypanosoma congolense (strain IL3000) TaxID=1068625 RepID=F9W4E8_TRYCI|nr:unnamed protein product [Trypanosoma congolense IL3000]
MFFLCFFSVLTLHLEIPPSKGMRHTRFYCFIGNNGPGVLGSWLGNVANSLKGSMSKSGAGFLSTHAGTGSPLFVSKHLGGFSGMFSSTGNASGSGGRNADDGSGGGTFGGPFGTLFDKALEWCSESHARDIARREGIDVRDIRFEKTPEGGIKVIVDAPSATFKQIEQLGEKVMEECPVARFRKTQVTSPQQKVEWVRLPDRYDR